MLVGAKDYKFKNGEINLVSLVLFVYLYLNKSNGMGIVKGVW